MTVTRHDAQAGGAGQEQRPWNIFATELERILSAPGRGLTIDMLDKLTAPDPRTGVVCELIHSEKVHRLVISLYTPETLPTLSKRDLDRVYAYCQFSDEERLSMGGALIAVFVQRVLNARIGPNDARQGAEQLLPIIVEALRRLGDDEEGTSALRGGIDSLWNSGHQRREDVALAATLEIIDRATLDLGLSYHVTTAAERLDRAQAALAGFIAALTALDAAEDDIQQTDAWRFWREEAAQGRDDAIERIDDLGGA